MAAAAATHVAWMATAAMQAEETANQARGWGSNPLSSTMFPCIQKIAERSVSDLLVLA